MEQVTRSYKRKSYNGKSYQNLQEAINFVEIIKALNSQGKVSVTTSSATSTDSVRLTAFKTSKSTAAVWYAFVSLTLYSGIHPNKEIIRK